MDGGSDANAVMERKGDGQYVDATPTPWRSVRKLHCEFSEIVIPRTNPAAPTRPELRPMIRAENLA